MINAEKQPYLGANVSPSILAEIEFRHLLDADEHLLAVFDGMLLDEHGRRVGGLSMTDYLLLTNRQLVTWARGMWTDTVDGFAWKDVALLDAECWDPYHGRIAFCFRLPPPEQRPQRRVSVRGQGAPHHPAANATEIVNFLDMMPAEDVPLVTEMLQWVPEYLEVNDELTLPAVFADTFPAVPRMPRPRLEPAAPPPQPGGEPARKGGIFAFLQQGAEPAPAGNLVSAYEQQRVGGPAPSGMPNPFSALGGRAGPIAPEQPSIYDMARGLRMVMMHRDKVGPIMNRLTRAMARASEVVGGTADLVENLQDPDVRRVAYRVVRAQTGLPARPQRARQNQGAGQPAQVPHAERGRRIEVRLSSRPQAEPEADAPAARPPVPEQLRRQVTITRMEPAAGSAVGDIAPATGAISGGEPEISTGERVSVPIRRVPRKRPEPGEGEF
jgi:hypothetical protein